MALIKFEATDSSVYLDDVAIPLAVDVEVKAPEGTTLSITTAEGSMYITLGGEFPIFELEDATIEAITTTALIDAIDAGIADVYKIPVMSDAVRSQDYLEAPVTVNITSAGPTPPPPLP